MNLDEHIPFTRRHENLLNSMDQRLNQHSTTLELHSLKHEQHSKKLDEHSKKLDEHSKKLDEHSKKLDEHGEKIDNLTSAFHRLSILMEKRDHEIEMMFEILKGIDDRLREQDRMKAQLEKHENRLDAVEYNVKKLMKTPMKKDLSD
jgi:chromosome segregation ATPase